MMDLYDALIESIPEDAPLDDVFTTHFGAVALSGGNIGFSEFRITEDRERRPMIDPDYKPGRSLRELASLVKSWNLTEAAMGVAALNAYYNNVKMATENGLNLSSGLHSEDRNADPFITHQTAARGRKVTVLGHFPYLEKLLGSVCDLKIISSHPNRGDYPDEAAEYLLPESDFVFIGVPYFLNKSLPHMLELAENAFVGLVGPATVMSPVLFDYGVDELDGFIPKDPEIARRVLLEQENRKIYASGEKVSLRKTDYEAFKKRVEENA